MDYIKLIDILAWPVTMLFVLFGFRKYVSNAIKRVSSLSAGAGGVQMTFSEQILQAKNKIEDLKSGVTSKSAQLNGDSNYSIDLKEKHLLTYLTDIANKNGIILENKDIFSSTELLKESGVMNIEQVEMIQTVHNLLKSAGPSISRKELGDLDDLIAEVTK